MTDARWTDVDDDLQSSCRHFRNAVHLFEEGGFDADGLAGYRARMALQHAVQSGYKSLEGALVRILEILGEETPSGPRRHADLVRRVSRPLDIEGRRRPAILPVGISRDVDEARRFRHRAAHDYDNFEPHLATPSIEAARRLADELPVQIARFRELVDPPEARAAANATEHGGPRSREDGIHPVPPKA